MCWNTYYINGDKWTGVGGEGGWMGGEVRLKEGEISAIKEVFGPAIYLDFWVKEWGVGPCVPDPLDRAGWSRFPFFPQITVGVVENDLICKRKQKHHPETNAIMQLKHRLKAQTTFLRHISFRKNLFWKKQNVNTEEREGMDHKGVHLIEGDQQKWD